MSISVSNLTKQYGVQKAIDSISFQIEKGEIVGFLGPNGAGKTTTMKITTCFMPATSGTVKVCDLDTRTQAIDVQRNIGYLPEHNPLYIDMYVREYLLFVSSIHQIKNNRKRVDALIEEVGLVSHAHKHIKDLSKGYKQRVGLAQALIHDPEVLILDEPTTGLDPNQIIEIRNIIKGHGQNKTVLLSTHIMQEVEALCDRVIIIDKGKIIADNTTEALQKQMAAEEPLVVQFDKPIQKNELMKLRDISHIELIEERKWKISSSHDNFQAEVFDFAVGNNLKIMEMYKDHSSLEDIFRQLTNSPQ